MSSLSTLTHSEWDRKTRGLEVATAFSEHIRGKKVLITGVSPESIGSSTARSIASQSPCLLILASRTQSKLEQVVKSIRDAYPSTNVYTVLLNLMSQDSIKSAADQVTKMTDSLDVIVNNAGIMTPKLQYTNEGIEAQFGANHIGHFLFTNLLLPLLETASRSNPAGTTRVVNLTSLGHRLSPIRFHDYNFEGNPIPDGEKYQGGKIPDMCRAKEGEVYNGYIAYGQAKTANILFSVGLNKRFEKDGILSYAVHPGSIWTGLSRDLDAEGEAAIRKTSSFWKDHDQGAATSVVAAFDPALNNPKGILLHDCQMCEAAPYATDIDIAEQLWKLSKTLVKVDPNL